jgi:hypothetical protein
MKTIDLFQLCNTGPWITAGKDTQYKVVEDGDTVILAFEPSSSSQDWKDNFSFPVRPYRDMPVGWLAHGGFVRAWKAAKDQIVADVIPLLEGRALRITGYSHGGALAVLAHEWFNYNDRNPTTVTFGAPRVLWMPPKRILGRFENLITIRNRGDVVTHLPPWMMGFKHAGDLTRIGKRWWPSIKAHYPSEYREGLGV